jgi:hypothetical protein
MNVLRLKAAKLLPTQPGRRADGRIPTQLGHSRCRLTTSTQRRIMRSLPSKQVFGRQRMGRRLRGGAQCLVKPDVVLDGRSIVFKSGGGGQVVVMEHRHAPRSPTFTVQCPQSSQYRGQIQARAPRLTEAMLQDECVADSAVDDQGLDARSFPAERSLVTWRRRAPTEGASPGEMPAPDGSSLGFSK